MAKGNGVKLPTIPSNPLLSSVQSLCRLIRTPFQAKWGTIHFVGVEMKPNLRLWSVAHNEAGHAVIAHHEGILLKEAVIVPKRNPDGHIILYAYSLSTGNYV